MTEHLSLWRSVEKTDPAHTKHVNQRGGFTSIDSYWQIKRATEIFGPLGLGWGYKADIRYQDGLAIAVLDFWYKPALGVESTRSEPFTVVGANAYRSDKGHLDEDAGKKAVTDAITKALSYLGFSADVFMGKFDDSKYVASLKAESADDEKRLAAEKWANDYILELQACKTAGKFYDLKNNEEKNAKLKRLEDAYPHLRKAIHNEGVATRARLGLNDDAT